MSMALLQQFKAAGAHSVAGAMVHGGQVVARMRNGLCVPTDAGEALLSSMKLPPVVAPAVVVPAADLVAAAHVEPDPTPEPKARKAKAQKGGLPAPEASANPIADLDELLR